MATTLNEVMKDTADAIREKTGKSEKIAPINFAEEIKSISAGGGESDWHYFDVSNNNSHPQLKIMQYASVIKCYAEDLGGMSIAPLGVNLLIPNALNGTTAIAIDYSIEMIAMGTKMTIGQALTSASWFGDFTEITEAEFYDLNA